MKTLHNGKTLILRVEGNTLTLDVKCGGHLLPDQIDMVEAKGMVSGGEDTWFGPAEHRDEILQTIKMIDRDWVSLEAERLGVQQMRGGR